MSSQQARNLLSSSTMIRHGSRILLRQPAVKPTLIPNHRFISTAPPAQKSRTWKNTAVRWGLAAGIVYYYNTSNLFAEEPKYLIPTSQPSLDEPALQMLDSATPSLSPRSKKSPLYSPPSESETSNSQSVLAPSEPAAAITPDSPDLSSTEEEAHGEGAFNEETGEINWDCPCLGGMAHGPCGEQFRTAFSCFVFSKEDPKGMECIDHFKTMQGCFREHPEIYGAELAEEEEEARAAAAEAEAEVKAVASSPLTDNEAEASIASKASLSPPPEPASQQTHPRPIPLDPGEPDAESEGILPRSSHDATGANKL